MTLELPVAQVVVDTPLPHLDRPFDYLVPEEHDTAAQPGVRVRVRFSGRLTDGFLLGRVAHSEHGGRLARLERVVGTERVLTPEIATLARAVADRYAGVMADVLRLAVPPRHAAVEKEPSQPALPAVAEGLADLTGYDGGPALLARLRSPGRGASRAIWSVLPGDPSNEIAAAVAACVAGGRGALVVVPDARDVARFAGPLGSAIGQDAVVALESGLGPRERYRRYLRLLRGVAPVAVGTRAAVWAPVSRLGLIVVWDDGDDLHAEPRAPYPHTREVATLRSHLSGADVLIAGHTVSAEGQLLVESGWAQPLDPAPAARRAAWPAVHVVGDEPANSDDPAARAARIPTRAWRMARDALAAGAPVLIQVPRAGYLPRLACDNCRASAHCTACHGPLGNPNRTDTPRCTWCATPALGWRCPECGSERLRSTVVGARRTAEELGRAFPGTPVRISGGDHVLATVADEPALVVATPGAEPLADRGYAAALLLDAWMLLGRADLRAAEEALRRWSAAAALVRPANAGGRVAIVTASELPAVQALVTGRPRAFAERELAERQELHLPPAARLAALVGPPAAIAELLGLLELPVGAEVLGPVDVPSGRDAESGPVEQVIVRVPLAAGRALTATLKTAAATRSARKAEPVRIVVDPAALG